MHFFNTWRVRTTIRSAVDTTIMTNTRRLMWHIEVHHKTFVFLAFTTFVSQGDRFVRHIFELKPYNSLNNTVTKDKNIIFY